MDNDRSFLKYNRYYKYIEPFFKAPIVRTYTGLILSILTISFFIVFAIRPTIKTIISLNRQTIDGRVTDQKLQDKINALSLAQSEYSQFTNEMPIILGSLPENSSVAPFLRLFEGASQASGTTINSFQLTTVNLLDPPSSKKELTLRETGFTVVVTGTYNNLLSFLEILRKLQRIIIIDSIGIGTSRDKENRSLLQLNLTGKIYFYK